MICLGDIWGKQKPSRLTPVSATSDNVARPSSRTLDVQINHAHSHPPFELCLAFGPNLEARKKAKRGKKEKGVMSYWPSLVYSFFFLLTFPFYSLPPKFGLKAKAKFPCNMKRVLFEEKKTHSDFVYSVRRLLRVINPLC
jgi:hypothetical protein